jgi:high-affinity nickel permease
MIKVGSWTKLLVCCLVIIAASFLGYSKCIDGQATVAIITAVLGYVFGNTHGAVEANTTIETLNRRLVDKDKTGGI